MYIFRRHNKKHRSRGKEIEGRSNYSSLRFGSSHREDEYEPEGPEYDEDDENYRSSRRKLDRSTGALADRRKPKEAFESNRNMESMHKFSKSSRDVYFQSERERSPRYDSFDPLPKSARSGMRRDNNYDGYDDAAQPAGNSKFNFDHDQGFESDFNTAPTEKSLRFSNEFADKDAATRNHQSTSSAASKTQFPEKSPANEFASTSTPKLRFDENITISKFDTNSDLFEDDDFSKAQFNFENEDQWIEELPKKNNLKSVTSHKRFENIKKSESVNIFAKNLDDPFEDDDFFKKTSPDNNKDGTQYSSHKNNNNYKWENNFAKFDENI